MAGGYLELYYSAFAAWLACLTKWGRNQVLQHRAFSLLTMAAQCCPWFSLFQFIVDFLKADVIQPSTVGLVPLDGFYNAFLK